MGWGKKIAGDQRCAECCWNRALSAYSSTMQRNAAPHFEDSKLPRKQSTLSTAIWYFPISTHDDVQVHVLLKPVWTFKGSSDKHAILKLYLCLLYQHCTFCLSLWFSLLCVTTLNTQTILSCVGLNTMSWENKQFQPQQNSNYSCSASAFIRALHSNYQRTYSDTVMIETREKTEEIINTFFA